MLKLSSLIIPNLKKNSMFKSEPLQRLLIYLKINTTINLEGITVFKSNTNFKLHTASKLILSSPSKCKTLRWKFTCEIFVMLYSYKMRIKHYLYDFYYCALICRYSMDAKYVRGRKYWPTYTISLWKYG